MARPILPRLPVIDARGGFTRDAWIYLTQAAAAADWASIEGIPATFPPEAHNHVIADVTGLQAALDAAGVALSGSAVITVANGRREWSETVAAVGVTPTSRVMVALGSHDDDDENSADMLDLIGLSATPGTNEITVVAGFLSPVAGPINILWSAA